MSTPTITVTRSSDPTPDERRAEILANPGFGTSFADHMFAVDWTPDRGWHDARITPYGPISLDPATSVLHYAQEIFEGLKVYRHADGTLWTFRPERNAARMNRSAQRLALPEIPQELFIEAINQLVRVDADWVPDQEGEKSLYVRPFMFSSEAFLGVRPAKHVTFMIITSPAGAYFAKGVKPVNIWLSEKYARAGRGGMGAAKTGGNYASSLVAQQEAYEHGCDQVAFLDSVEHTWIEELGGMNLFFVHDDGSVITPELTGTILEGVTRASILELFNRLGHKTEERRISIDEWREGVSSGRITEVFACGTAAVVTPVGKLVWHNGEVGTGADFVGPVTHEIRQTLVDVQYGRTEDTYGWMHQIP